MSSRCPSGSLLNILPDKSREVEAACSDEGGGEDGEEIKFILMRFTFQEKLFYNGGRKFDLGSEIDPEFKDQNILSSNILDARRDDEPFRYGLFKTIEDSEN